MYYPWPKLQDRADQRGGGADRGGEQIPAQGETQQQGSNQSDSAALAGGFLLNNSCGANSWLPV